MQISLNNPNCRTAIICVAVVLHFAACVGLLLVASGTEANQDMSARLAFVTRHRVLWIAVWVVWMFASASLLAFCLVWSAVMAESGVAWTALLPACSIIGVGVLFDFAGETTLILAASIDPTHVAAFAWQARLFQILSPAVANGLYCVGGTLLSVLAWKHNWLVGWRGALGFAMWLVGIGLTIGGIFDHRELLAITGAGVMILFLSFASVIAWKVGSSRAAA